jgi:hypothetical protein
MGDERRRALEDALSAFRDVPFPRGSADEELSDAHAELAEYDGYVAGLVTTLLEGGDVSPAQLAFDDDLRQRFERAPAQEEARRYVEYMDELRRLLDAARAYASEAG